jgi:hypothetical protein
VTAAYLGGDRPELRAIAGSDAGSKLIYEVRDGHAHPDALFNGIHARLVAGDVDGARALARHFQKVVELDSKAARATFGGGGRAA